MVEISHSRKNSATILTEGSSSNRKDRMPIGVSLRSNIIKPLRSQQTLAKVGAALRELGVGIRPVMATAPICTAYDRLQSSVQQLLELKKVVDRLEHEKRTEGIRRTELASKLSPEQLQQLANEMSSAPKTRYQTARGLENSPVIRMFY